MKKTAIMVRRQCLSHPAEIRELEARFLPDDTVGAKYGSLEEPHAEKEKGK